MRYGDLILTRDFRPGMYISDSKIIVDDELEKIEEVGIAWLPLKGKINKELVEVYRQYKESGYADYLFIGGATGWVDHHFLGPQCFWGYVRLNSSAVKLEMFGIHEIDPRQIGYSLDFIRDNRVFTLVPVAQLSRFPVFKEG